MTEPEKSKARLYVDTPLSATTEVSVNRDQARYLGSVLRLGPGDIISLFNGRDGEWRSAITSISKSGATLKPESQTRVQVSEPDLWLAFAPLKKSQTDMLVEKATELGVSRLLPVFTHHTNAERVNLDRMTTNAIEAAEQCERLSIPVVAEPQTFSQLIASWPQERVLLVADEQGGGRPLAEVAGSLQADPPPPCGILVGPEGGFAESELEAISNVDATRRIGLGPRILRAETAAIAALAAWQLIAGDGNKPPRQP